MRVGLRVGVIVLSGVAAFLFWHVVIKGLAPMGKAKTYEMLELLFPKYKLKWLQIGGNPQRDIERRLTILKAATRSYRADYVLAEAKDGFDLESFVNEFAADNDEKYWNTQGKWEEVTDAFEPTVQKLVREGRIRRIRGRGNRGAIEIAEHEAQFVPWWWGDVWKDWDEMEIIRSGLIWMAVSYKERLIFVCLDR